MTALVGERYLVFVLITSLLILFSKIKCNDSDSSWNWTHPIKQTTTSESGSRVTVDHMKFIRCLYYYMGKSYIFRGIDTYSNLECGNLCMEEPRCLAWIFDVDYKSCRLYDYRFKAYPLKAMVFAQSSDTINCYELEVYFYAFICYLLFLIVYIYI